MKEGLLSFFKHFNQKMLIMLAGNIASVLVNIAIVKVLTNKLSTGNFGSYSLTTSVATFPQLVLFAPIASAIFPFIKEKKNEKKYHQFQTDIFDLLWLIFIISIIILSVLSLVCINTNFLPKGILELIWLGFVFSSSLSFLNTLDTFLLANSKINLYTLFPVINLVLKFLSLLVAYNITYNVAEVLILFTIAHVLLCFIEFFFLKKNSVLDNNIFTLSFKRIFDISSAGKKKIIRYGYNFFLWGIFGWGQVFLDKYVLNHFTNTKLVGIYAVYYQYGFYPFTIFSTIISQYLTPMFFDRVDDKSSILAFLKRLTLYNFGALIILCPCLTLAAYYVAPYFIKLLTASIYLEYIKFFPIIVIGGFLYGLGQILTVPLLNSDFVNKMRFPKIGSTVLAVALFYILIPRYQLMGILLAIVLSNAFYFICLVIINFMYVKQLTRKLSGRND